MKPIDAHFHEYFEALDRSNHDDRCYLCRRTPADVKRFFGFDEDGVPIDAARFGLEDVVLAETDIMSYRGVRPVCAVCQLNFDGLFALGEQATIRTLIDSMESRREELWPREPA